MDSRASLLPTRDRPLTSQRDRSSVISVTRSSAVEVHDIVYCGDTPQPTPDILDRLYEPAAGARIRVVTRPLQLTSFSVRDT
jgi:hypothetical protein